MKTTKHTTNQKNLFNVVWSLGNNTLFTKLWKIRSTQTFHRRLSDRRHQMDQETSQHLWKERTSKWKINTLQSPTKICWIAGKHHTQADTRGNISVIIRGPASNVTSGCRNLPFLMFSHHGGWNILWCDRKPTKSVNEADKHTNSLFCFSFNSWHPKE